MGRNNMDNSAGNKGSSVDSEDNNRAHGHDHNYVLDFHIACNRPVSLDIETSLDNTLLESHSYYCCYHLYSSYIFLQDNTSLSIYDKNLNVLQTKREGRTIISNSYHLPQL